MNGSWLLQYRYNQGFFPFYLERKEEGEKIQTKGKLDLEMQPVTLCYQDATRLLVP